MQNDEAELIAQSLSGKSDAYAQLIDRYKHAIYHHCFAMLRDRDAAEDMAQETFISAYYSLKQYRRQYKFSTWLFRISTNKCLNYLKKHRREVPQDELIARIASNEALPHERAVQTEVSTALHAAIGRLRPQYRAVISLYYWQGLDYETVAKAMDAPLNSVRVWLKRAKEDLRKDLA